MAAGYPPNLDDGELWLPSEIIPDLGPCRRRQHHRHLPPSDLAYIEDLAQQLAAFGFVDRHPRPSPYPPTLAAAPPVDRLAVQRDLAARLMCHRLRSLPPAPAATGAYIPGLHGQCRPGMVPVQFINRMQPLDGFCFGPGRGRVARQPSRFVPPVRSRESVGTGVFLPRVGADSEARKKVQKLDAGMKGVEQVKQAWVTAEKRQGVPMQPELGLPQEWTY